MNGKVSKMGPEEKCTGAPKRMGQIEFFFGVHTLVESPLIALCVFTLPTLGPKPIPDLSIRGPSLKRVSLDILAAVRELQLSLCSWKHIASYNLMHTFMEVTAITHNGTYYHVDLHRIVLWLAEILCILSWKKTPMNTM